MLVNEVVNERMGFLQCVISFSTLWKSNDLSSDILMLIFLYSLVFSFEIGYYATRMQNIFGNPKPLL